MSLLKNRYYLYFVLSAALIVGGYLCTVSVTWTMTFCFLAPLMVGYMLRKFVEDHDFSDELRNNGVDAQW